MVASGAGQSGGIGVDIDADIFVNAGTIIGGIAGPGVRDGAGVNLLFGGTVVNAGFIGSGGGTAGAVYFDLGTSRLCAGAWCIVRRGGARG